MSLSSVFTDIADAIRSKNGSSDTYTPAEMPQAIQDIPTGGGGIDWEKFEADDGKTRMLFEIPYDGSDVSFTLYRTNSCPAVVDWGDGTIEEYPTGRTSIALTHTYAAAGEFIFEMSNGDLAPTEVINTSFEFQTPSNSGDPTVTYISAACFGRNNSQNQNFPAYARRLTLWARTNHIQYTSNPYLESLKVQTNSGSTATYPSLSSVSCLNYLKYDDAAHKFPGITGSMLREIQIPDGTTYLITTENNPALLKLTIPDTITDYVGGALRFRWNYCLEDLVLPAAVATASQSFCQADRALKRTYFKGDITSIESQAFYGCSGADALIFSSNTAVPTLANFDAFNSSSFKPTAAHRGYIYVPDALVEDWKVATNWTTVADSIKPLSELPEEYKI